MILLYTFMDPMFQKTFNLDLDIPTKDRYVLVVNYYSNGNGNQSVLFNITTTGDQATAHIYNCQYRYSDCIPMTLCKLNLKPKLQYFNEICACMCAVIVSL